MKATEIFRSYGRHLNRVDGEFSRVHRKFADRMQCGKGCSMCCSQMFSISLIEAAFISRGVKRLPAEERARLQSAAREYISLAKNMSGDGAEEESVVPRPGMRLPCPALVGDACSIYELRPIICRKWGIPIFNPKRPAELQACELNFKAGEEIEVDDLLEPQVDLLEEWVELKARARETLRHPAITTTIAEAIAGDFDRILFGDDSVKQVS